MKRVKAPKNREAIAALLAVVFVAAVGLAGCSHDENPVSAQPTEQDELTTLLAAPQSPDPTLAPAPLVVVNGPATAEFWPYTGTNFSGEPQDPINLVFFGHADPREIRAALMALDGDRSAFGMPDQSPWNARWGEAIGGDVQTGYASDEGWTGGAIQLACGDYAMRFHLRLFRMGDWTIGNAHLDLNIPGTADHQVISWERAEEFVTVDLMRTALLDPDMGIFPTDPINQPDFRTIPAVIYNMLPVELRAYIGGPLGDVTADVPIGSNGVATAFVLAGSVPVTAGVQMETLPIVFDQVVPRPFCSSGPADYVYVSGTVVLSQSSEITGGGDYHMTFDAEGELQVVPVDPATGTPIGAPLSAQIREHHAALLSDSSADVSSWVFQKLISESGGSSSLFRRLRAGDNGVNSFAERIRCE